MDYVIMTGRSGAGKSTALKILEDLGYFCIDNMPVELLGDFLKLAAKNPARFQKVALGLDVRNGESLNGLLDIVKKVRDGGGKIRIVFMDARDEVLIRRYTETRRVHPLAGIGRTEDGIAREHEMIDFLRDQADYIIDTSDLLNRDLRQELEGIFVKNSRFQSLMVTVMSFGYKYGLPSDSDLVFDVRFLPNPFYDPSLRSMSGNEAPVRDYVMKSHLTEQFMEKLQDLLNFLIPNYIAEGKNRLVISIGCTGGRHRSVAVANGIYEYLKDQEGFGVTIRHRDLNRKDNHVVLS